MKTVCVYCASGTNMAQSYFTAAAQLGRLIGENGIRLINGAGSTGLMRTCTDAAMNAGGKAIGIIPQFMVDRGWQYGRMSKIIVTKDMHERKQIMAQTADACIAMPGGCGTLEELMEIITWKQIGIYSKPIVILNIEGYFSPLLQMLDNAIDEHFMSQEHANLWKVANTPEEAIEMAMGQL